MRTQGRARWTRLPEDEAVSLAGGASPQPWHLPCQPPHAPGCGHVGTHGVGRTRVCMQAHQGDTHSGMRLLRHTQTQPVAAPRVNGEGPGCQPSLPSESPHPRPPHPQPAPGGAGVGTDAGGPGGCRWCPGQGEGVLTGAPSGRDPGRFCLRALRPGGPSSSELEVGRPLLATASSSARSVPPPTHRRSPLQFTEGPPVLPPGLKNLLPSPC